MNYTATVDEHDTVTLIDRDGQIVFTGRSPGAYKLATQRPQVCGMSIGYRIDGAIECVNMIEEKQRT